MREAELYSRCLFHSAKGTEWKNHKYIKKENGRYYYKDTDKGRSKKSKDELLEELNDVQERMRMCDEKAKEFDALIENGGSDKELYRAEAQKYRDEITRLNKERDEIASAIEDKEKTEDVVNKIKDPVGTVSKFGVKNWKTMYIGVPRFKFKHDDEDSDELYHHGILGMKWGVRRYQNEDGSLTAAGKKRYSKQGKAFEPLGDTKLERDAAEAFTRTVNSSPEYSVESLRKLYSDYQDAWSDWYFNDGTFEESLTGPKAIKKNDLEDKYSRFERALEKNYYDVVGLKKDQLTDDDVELANLALMELLDAYVYKTKSSSELASDYYKKAKHGDTNSDELYHHGILGMKWGVRRYRNEDGSLTDAGKKRYHKRVEKLRKLEVKQEKNKARVTEERKYKAASLRRRADKLKYKATKEEAKAVRFLFPKDPAEVYRTSLKYKTKAAKLDVKASRIESKMARESYNAERYEKAGKKLVKKLLATTADIKIKDIDKNDYEYLMDRASRLGIKHSDTSSSELYHHGVLGMKWGVRRYQNEDGSLTSAGKKRYGSFPQNVFAARRRKKKQAEALEKRRATIQAKKDAEEEARLHEEEKQKAITTGKASDIVKFQNELSNQELQDALRRLDLKRQLNSLSEAETPKVQTGMDRLEAAMKKAKRASDIAENGIRAYNTFAKINNTFSKNKKLPIIKDADKKDDDGNNKQPKNQSQNQNQPKQQNTNTEKAVSAVISKVNKIDTNVKETTGMEAESLARILEESKRRSEEYTKRSEAGFREDRRKADEEWLKKFREESDAQYKAAVELQNSLAESKKRMEELERKRR